MDCSLPGSPSLGFSRQEHWSGLPFPSPMYDSEKIHSDQGLREGRDEGAEHRGFLELRSCSDMTEVDYCNFVTNHVWEGGGSHRKKIIGVNILLIQCY